MHRVEHAQIVDSQDIGRFAELGVRVRSGEVRFEPSYLARDEFSPQPAERRYVAAAGERAGTKVQREFRQHHRSWLVHDTVTADIGGKIGQYNIDRCAADSAPRRCPACCW